LFKLFYEERIKSEYEKRDPCGNAQILRKIRH
jgi:hypothetical protein